MEKKKVKRHVKELDPINGLFKFEEYLDIIREYYTDELDLDKDTFFAQRISSVMSHNIKIAYWDLLEEEIENHNYNKLGESITDLRDLIKSCVPHKKEVHLELDEYLDQTFIIQKIQNEVFSKEQLEKLVNYIIGKLEEYQSELDDDSTEEFKLEMESLLDPQNDTYEISFIIRFFLETCTLKFDAISRQRELFLSLLEKNKV